MCVVQTRLFVIFLSAKERIKDQTLLRYSWKVLIMLFTWKKEWIWVNVHHVYILYIKQNPTTYKETTISQRNSTLIAAFLLESLTTNQSIPNNIIYTWTFLHFFCYSCFVFTVRSLQFPFVTCWLEKLCQTLLTHDQSTFNIFECNCYLTEV